MSINITDPYQIRQAFDDLKKEFIPEEKEETLELGFYGVMSAMISNMTVMTTQAAADKANEVFANRARLSSSVITHAVSNGIDITYSPSRMDILLCFVEEELQELFDKNQNDIDPVVIDSDIPLMIGKYEYHLDYPLLLYKKQLASRTVYTAQYDLINYTNPISKITNPYLPAPYTVRNSGFNYIYIPCSITQVEVTNNYKKLNTNNVITNKTYIIKFQNQLCGFDVTITMGDYKYILTPICEGSAIPDDTTNYCWYTYLDSNTLRIKFDDNSITPGINSEIVTRIYTTLGKECNFSYEENGTIITNVSDTNKFKYNSMSCMIVPQSDSMYGKDKRSISELKTLLPKESLSRGNIVKRKDLDNYFKKLNTESVIVTTQEKVDNQAMREYYLYLLMSDKQNKIVPTNTLPVLLKEEDFDKIITLNNEKQYILKQGRIIGYNRDMSYATIISESERNSYDFSYTIPFKTVINGSVPSISYFMTTMNESYITEYNYINTNSPLQFIISNAGWKRDYSGENSSKYTLSLRAFQNVDIDYGITKDNITAIAVLYNGDNTPSRYFKSTCIEASEKDGRYYDLEIDFLTNDIIDENNNIRIDNGYAIGQDSVQYGYFSQNTKIDIYLVCNIKDPETGNITGYGYKESGLDELVGTLTDLDTCTNLYKLPNGIDFFDNYSEVMNTVVKANSITNEDNTKSVEFTLDLVPLLGYDYSNMSNGDLLLGFIEKLKEEKKYIDDMLYVFDGGMSIDFKFYNTYGPSRLYSLTKDGSVLLDRVNIGLKFNLNLRKISDTYTVGYIKQYIKENIDDLTKTGDFHIPKFIADINSKYSNSIYYIESEGINDYGTQYMHFYYNNANRIWDIPEFININYLDESTPEIIINIVE